MPIGGDWIRTAPTPALQRQVIPVPAAHQAPAAPGRAERHAGDYDVWHARTLASAADAAASTDWSAGVASIELPGACTRLEVWADEALYISISGTISPNPGGYQLFHPGGGELVKVTPPTRRVTIRTVTGASPVKRVELLALGGSFALRS